MATSKTSWIRTWPGGRVRLDEQGNEVFVLEKRDGQRRYSIRLDVANEKLANVELGIWERDPEGYQTKTKARRQVAEAAVTLDPETAAEFLEYLKAKERSETYRKDAQHYLADWAEFYRGRDIRKVPLRALLAELDRHKAAPARASPGVKKPAKRLHRGAEKVRITVLKSFTHWLRSRDMLKRAEDPTQELKIPAAQPEKVRRAKLGKKKFYQAGDVARLYKAIVPRDGAQDAQAVRDVLRLSACYGLHLTEIERIAAGECDLTPVEHDIIAGTVRFWHKTEKVHTVSLDGPSYAACQRLKARGSAPVKSYIRKVLQLARKSIGLKDAINLGTLRHSFTTWAKQGGKVVSYGQGGAPLTAIAAVLGHETTRTTTRHYLDDSIPDMIVLPMLDLTHPEDPIPLQRKGSDGSRVAGG